MERASGSHRVAAATLRPCAIAAAIAVTFSVGCLGPGTTRAPRLFVLDAVVPEAAVPKTDLSIVVGPVSLPMRLDRPQILTRTSEYEVRISEFDQWAEPLEKSFARVLAQNLSRAIPTDRVSVYPWNRTVPIDVQVEVTVTRFESELNGDTTLAARWRLLGPKGHELLPMRGSTFRENPGSQAVKARVSAMSHALGALGNDIAAAVLALTD